MPFFKKVIDFIAGSGSNVIDTIADTVDRFVKTPEEREKLKQELMKIQEEQQQNQRNFIMEMERLTQEREAEIEATIRAELDSQKEILIAELNQGDNYTKRARPTVVYAGLVFILLEILGLRIMILDAIGVSQAMVQSSNEIFQFFLVSWAGVVGVYSVGRSIEKRGTRNAWTSTITGSGNLRKTSAMDQVITKNIKEKLKDFKWQ
ncbi:MAG: 3TM-type holin [Candidatus Cyclobacteriaceae bacterium M3_2C_046]